MSISPPRPKNPPLNALRAFESAARLGGFSKAADELCVTPGAISQHIKSLEEWAGAPLFKRRSQGVGLTELGMETASQFSEAFDALGGAVRSLRSGARQSTINIAALPSVAQLWLSPRLPAIRAALSDLKISITALETPPNLYREMFDISIFLNQPTSNQAEKIIRRDWMFPVCSPQVAKRLRRPADLLNEVWLYDALWVNDWQNWRAKAAPELTRQRDGPHFSLYSIAVEEAKNGAGVLIGHEMLIEALLKSGELVAPFDQKVASDMSLNLQVADEASTASGVQQIVAKLCG